MLFQKIKQPTQSAQKELDHNSQLLNLQLYKDVNSIDNLSLKTFERQMKRYSKKLKYSKSFCINWMTHNYRLYLSMQYIQSLVIENNVHSILEIGFPTIFTYLLKDKFHKTGVKIINSKGDIRKDLGIGNNKIDLIVCMEVVEHISDINTKYGATFWTTGLRSLLDKCFRQLNKNGILFITTPNVTSVVNIQHIMQCEMPMLYKPHIREYSATEISSILTRSMFKLEKNSAVHCITAGDRRDYSNIFSILSNYNFPTADRGDDLFIVARKK